MLRRLINCRIIISLLLLIIILQGKWQSARWNQYQLSQVLKKTFPCLTLRYDMTSLQHIKSLTYNITEISSLSRLKGDIQNCFLEEKNDKHDDNMTVFSGQKPFPTAILNSRRHLFVKLTKVPVAVKPNIINQEYTRSLWRLCRTAAAETYSRSLLPSTHSITDCRVQPLKKITSKLTPNFSPLLASRATMKSIVKVFINNKSTKKSLKTKL